MKKQQNKQQQQQKKQEAQPRNFSIISLLILSAYIGIELIALEDYIDNKGIHWLLISVVNLFGLGVLLCK